MSPKNLTLVVLTLMSVWFAVRTGFVLMVALPSGLHGGGLPPGSIGLLGLDWSRWGHVVALTLPFAGSVALWVARRPVARWVSGPGSASTGAISGPALRRAALGLYGVFLVASSVENLGWTLGFDRKLWMVPVPDHAVQSLVGPSIQMPLGLLLILFCPLAGMVFRQAGEEEFDFV